MVLIQLPRTALGSGFSPQCLSQGWVARSLVFSFILNTDIEASKLLPKGIFLCAKITSTENSS